MNQASGTTTSRSFASSLGEPAQNVVALIVR